ncbi:uncharacterized protein LOC106460769 [Limulus polyphemus]|uniref:Uncharacterized protein LOC106460769 n=1 Tax=Limulus polyphemus TaxID=6850 RepID=A0ABM1B6T3_LIMPO|nr:uncharacterized protein LOC106460769 [Limulus polyphemus]
MFVKMWMVATIECLIIWLSSVKGYHGNLSALFPESPEFSDIESSVIRLMIDQNRTYSFLGVTVNNHFRYRQILSSEETWKLIPSLRSRRISHHLVALAVLKLAEEQKLTLYDHVFGFSGLLRKIFPWQQLSNIVVDHLVYEITIEHLLMQTSGLECQIKNGASFNFENFNEQRRHVNNKEIKENLKIRRFVNVLSFLLSKPLYHPPGVKQCSGDEGFVILCFVIESVIGQKCKDFIKNTFLLPLGMWQTYLSENCFERNMWSSQALAYSEACSAIEPTVLSNSTQVDPGNYIFSFFADWIFSAYDVLRLFSYYYIDYIHKISSLSSLKFIFEQAAKALPQHNSRWHIMGIRIDNNGVIWIESDRSSNDDFVIGCKITLGKMQYHIPFDKNQDFKSTCWLFLLSARKGNRLKKTLDRLWVKKIDSREESVFPDLLDVTSLNNDQKVNRGVKFSVPRILKQTYERALNLSNLTVFQVNEYIFSGRHYFSFILTSNMQHKSLVAEARNHFNRLPSSYGDHLNRRNPLELLNTEALPKHKILKWNGSKPQSIFNISVKRILLESQIKLHTKRGLYLKNIFCSLIDSELYVTFTTKKSRKWILNTQLIQSEVEKLSRQYEKSGFVITELCGYEENQRLYFMVRWVKF